MADRVTETRKEFQSSQLKNSRLAGSQKISNKKMNSKQMIALISLCMCLVHAVVALPRMADPQAPPANRFREARNADSDTEIDIDGESTSTNRTVVTVSCAQTAEKLAKMNVISENALYPFSALAETIHSHREKQHTGASDVLHADVCRDVMSMANRNLPNDTQTPCPWNYTCSYHPDKYPHYILEANCLKEYCTFPCGQSEIANKQCVRYSTTHSFLKLPDNGCDGTQFEENIEDMTIYIGCDCQS